MISIVAPALYRHSSSYDFISRCREEGEGPMSRQAPSPFHDGEIAVQTRAGVRAQARRVGGIIDTNLPPDADDFLQRQRLVVAASVGADGRVWASLLTGPPGFLRANDAVSLQIAAPITGDPLATNLEATGAIGLLLFDPATRQRWRINGTATPTDRGLLVRTAQVYGNCPKYIQARTLADESVATPVTPTRARGEVLTAPQQRLIAGADTFFIASADEEGNADASHRGGSPGFVRVLDEGTLVWPDYAGNTMFNTLGNFAVNPRAGLLFVDFARGSTIQLTGTARIDWDPARAATFPGAERVVEFRIGVALETFGATGQRWALRARSPFNPPALA